MGNQILDRRPISARNNQVFINLSLFLSSHGVAPNTISVISTVFAACAGVCLFFTSINMQPRLFWGLAIVFVLLRLLANMLDGMVAIETGKQSIVGGIFNEVPDRISDIIIFVGAGFSAGSSFHLGYLAAVLSLLVAYIRALGNHMGVSKLFTGPMAKSHRMFALVVICAFNLFLPELGRTLYFMSWGLMIIIVGSVVTFIRRLAYIFTMVQL